MQALCLRAGEGEHCPPVPTDSLGAPKAGPLARGCQLQLEQREEQAPIPASLCAAGRGLLCPRASDTLISVTDTNTSLSFKASAPAGPKCLVCVLRLLGFNTSNSKLPERFISHLGNGKLPHITEPLGTAGHSHNPHETHKPYGLVLTLNKGQLKLPMLPKHH